MFGWSGDHTHRASVYSHVEMYSGNYKVYHMKKYGKPAPLSDGADEGMLTYWELARRTDIAEYEVVMKGHNIALRGYNSFGDLAYNVERRVEDQDLCLSQVWNQKLRKNASKGACGNKEIGVIYEYDLGDAHGEVFVELDGRQKDISSMFYDDGVFKSSEGDEEMGSDSGEEDEGMGSDSGDSDEEEHSQGKPALAIVRYYQEFSGNPPEYVRFISLAL
ncbi:hypothetical protein B0H19DRAFT_1058599 [Mycena capillaripes]|nr:hypothetical protein B0H19DRAFT_1058599 [Mycena capillaripes]